MFKGICRGYELKGSMGHILPILQLRRSVVESAHGIVSRRRRQNSPRRAIVELILEEIPLLTLPKQAFVFQSPLMESPQGGLFTWALYRKGNELFQKKVLGRKVDMYGVL